MNGSGRGNMAVIVNPGSSSVSPKTESDLAACLKQAGIPFEIAVLKPGADAEKLAEGFIRAGARHVIASGGDGTVMAVMNAIIKSGEDVLLSLSPGGTANLIAAALEIPGDVEESVQIALHGHERSVDVGRLGERYFALGVGVGIGEKLVSGTDDALKDRLGRLAYALAAFAEVGSPPIEFLVRGPDGELKLHGVGLVVANVGGIGNRIRFAPDARMDDGLLDLCVLKRLSLWDAFRLGSKAIFGGLQDDRAVDYYQWSQVEILNSGLPIQIDGETVDDTTPVSISIAPRAVRVTAGGEPSPEKPQGSSTNR